MSTELLPVDDEGVDIDAHAPTMIARPAATTARECLANEVLGMMGFR
jgi:hypothetical protein